MSEAMTIPQPHPALDPLIFAVGGDLWADIDPKIVLDINGLISGTHSYCFAHHEIEPARWDRCGECGHGFDTIDQLLDEDYAASLGFYPDQAVRAHSAAEVWVCPACSHDL